MDSGRILAKGTKQHKPGTKNKANPAKTNKAAWLHVFLGASKRRKISATAPEQQRFKDDEKKRNAEKLRSQSGPKAIRQVRELVRQRYELDVSIWERRNIRLPDRKFVLDDMARSDLILQQVQQIVEEWDSSRKESGWSDKEWRLALEIKRRLLEDTGKRVWANNPPWGQDVRHNNWDYEEDDDEISWY